MLWTAVRRRGCWRLLPRGDWLQAFASQALRAAPQLQRLRGRGALMDRDCVILPPTKKEGSSSYMLGITLNSGMETMSPLASFIMVIGWLVLVKKLVRGYVMPQMVMGRRCANHPFVHSLIRSLTQGFTESPLSASRCVRCWHCYR